MAVLLAAGLLIAAGPRGCGERPRALPPEVHVQPPAAAPQSVPPPEHPRAAGADTAPREMRRPAGRRHRRHRKPRTHAIERRAPARSPSSAPPPPPARPAPVAPTPAPSAPARPAPRPAAPEFF